MKTTTIQTRTACENIYITLPKDISFIRLNLGKSGCCTGCLLEALQDIINLALQAGVTREHLVRALQGGRCQNDSVFLPSCPEAISKTIKKELENEKSNLVANS